MFGKNLKRELYIISFLLLIALSGLIFNGCENATQSIFSETGVKGKVYGLFGVPYQGLKVTAGDIAVNTDIYGRFNIPGVAHPYNLAIIDTSTKNCLYIPKHDKTTSNSLALSYFSTYQNNAFASILVNYPDSLKGYSIKCFFTDFDDKTFCTTQYDSSGMISIEIGEGTQYKGALMVLAYSFINGHAVSYDKYCIKNDISISSGSNLVINLLNSDFKNVGQQNKYRVNLIPPAGNNLDYIFSAFSLTNRRVGIYSAYMLIDTFNTPTVDVLVPSGLGLNLYPLICFTSIGPNGYSNSVGYFNGNASFSAPEIPVLVSPGDNELVDINTEIVFNQGLSHVENKYYKLIVTEQDGGNGPHRTFTVYLDRERMKISELNEIGFGNLYGCSFNWSVDIISGVSLNDGISDGISNLTRMMSSSNGRKFTVKQL